MSEYEEREQGQQRAAAAPQITYVPPLPVPDQAAIQLELQQRALQRYQQFFDIQAVAQRSSAAPVLEAAQVQRSFALQRQQSQLALQRQIEALSEGLPPDVLQAALQRQAEQAGVPALPPVFSGPTRSQPSYADHAQRYAHEAVSLQRQADQHSGFVAMSAWPTIQQRATQDLVQRFRQDTSPAIQRYAELGRSLALVQRQPQGKQVARVVLQRLPAGERPMVQRALDEAEQEHQQFQAQDQNALQLHALQRKLTEEENLAPIALPSRSGQPLSLAVQRQLEVGLNIPREHLQSVRVHVDSSAHSFAKSVQAIAATVGTHIFFQQGKLDTESAEGQELLAHEVTHTYQQAQGKVTGKGIDPDPGLEQEAREAGRKFAQRVSPMDMPSVLKGEVKSKTRAAQRVPAPQQSALQRRATDEPKQTGPLQDWAGTLANTAVSLKLRQNGGKLHGRYSYQGHADFLTVEGTLDATGKVQLTERDAGGKVTGTFEGVLKGDTLDGQWTSAQSGRAHRFSLRKNAAGAQQWAHDYAGHVGGAAIHVHLGRQGDTLELAYGYDKSGPDLPLRLSGKLSDPTKKTFRCEGSGEVFEGAFVGADGATVRGKWHGNGKTLDFEFRLSQEKQSQADKQPAQPGGEISEQFIDAVLAALPDAMRRDPITVHGKVGQRVEPNLTRNPRYREDTRRILQACLNAGITDKAQIAYVLTSAAHESSYGRNMRELGGFDYFEHHYGPDGKAPARAKSMGNTQPGDGFKYRGRGFVQVTWEQNYATWQQKLEGYEVDGKKIDLISNPDLIAQDRDLAAKILAEGLRDGVFAGIWTAPGRKRPMTRLNELNEGHADQLSFAAARNLVNGGSLAEPIGGAAEALYLRLRQLQPFLDPQNPQQSQPPGELAQSMVKMAQEGLTAGWSPSLGYSCSAWVRTVVEHALQVKDHGLSRDKFHPHGLFGISALKTLEYFKSEGLTQPYQGEGELQPGDILFWDVPSSFGHIAVYLGGGKVAGNHYVIYLRAKNDYKSAGQQLSGKAVRMDDGTVVYDGIDSRGILHLESVAGNNRIPIMVARFPKNWSSKK